MTLVSDLILAPAGVTRLPTPKRPQDACTKAYADALVVAAGSVEADLIWDAKGDLAVGTGADTADNLAVGTDGYVLTADSAEPTGIKWAAATGGSGDDTLAWVL